jgi:hypothetical protein
MGKCFTYEPGQLSTTTTTTLVRTTMKKALPDRQKRQKKGKSRDRKKDS